MQRFASSSCYKETYFEVSRLQKVQSLEQFEFENKRVG
jgi:hypothetical protein